MENSQTPSRILVPIDYSEQSLIALEQAVNLSKVFHSEIHLLNVIEDDLFHKVFSADDSAEIRTKVHGKLQALVNEVAEKHSIKVEPHVVSGKIYDQVAILSEALNVAFVVMGTNGSVGLKKKFIGSNALRVVRESKHPVITIKGKLHRKGCQNIVLPLDLTKETREKVGQAIEFAKKFGSIVRIVSVLQTSDEFVVNRLTRQLDQAKKYMMDHGVDCTAEIIRDTKGEHSLAESILDYATKIKGDLIMIMTQQEEDFTEFFIGSAAQEIINTSDIPVLSITPKPKKDTTVFVPY
jgi:nucleotide-binding universal stress UspA family protein